MTVDNDPPRQPVVLILDDERDMCEFVADVGEECGFDAQWCDNFEDFACRYSIELHGIFLDLMMPGVDGVEIIRFLGDNNAQAQLVLMTGHDSHVLDAARRLAQSRGLTVVGALQKPIALADLKAVYQSLLQAAPPQPRQSSNKSAAQARLTPGELDAALSAGHIVPYFQPKFRVSDQLVVGAEVLARWICPQAGLIPPDRFINLAESCGLIDRLTDQIITKALDQCWVWAQGGRSMRIALNVSPLSLRRLDFPDQLLGLVTDRALNPSDITIEITESALADDYSASLDILTRLRMRRFGLSIDDFGTGYSSLKQLQSSPFTELKVDQSFIGKALVEDGSRAIVESSVSLGHRLGLKVVAEGIETEEQLALIRELGCEEAQGYLLGRPCKAADFPD